MVSLLAGVAIVIGAGLVAYALARYFGDTVQPAYDTTMRLVEAGRLLFIGATVFVFVRSGNIVLIILSAFIVVFAVMFLYFDYYSPTSNPSRS